MTFTVSINQYTRVADYATVQKLTTNSFEAKIHGKPLLRPIGSYFRRLRFKF